MKIFANLARNKIILISMKGQKQILFLSFSFGKKGGKGMKQIVFDYHYGLEAEQYAFYRIPKVLMSEPFFKTLSLEAKFLYGMMIDRMVLSAKNGWKDNTGRIYIYFTIEDICENLSCGKDKAVKALKELEKDVGLIERRKQGQGKPTMIFVKNFTRVLEEGEKTGGLIESNIVINGVGVIKIIVKKLYEGVIEYAKRKVGKQN